MTYNERGLYIDDDHLGAFAENTARSLRPVDSTPGNRYVGELSRALMRLRGAHADLEKKYASLVTIPTAAEWLLDNWYLAQREGASAMSDMRGSYLRTTDAGSPFLTELCAALVRAGQGEVTPERCEAFLTGAQKACALCRTELELFVPALKAAVIFALAKLYSGAESEDASASARLFTTLRTLSTADMSEMLERVDLIEQTLRRDPAGIYPLMDERTRESYRRRVSQLSHKQGLQEHRVAMRVLRLSENAKGEGRHVGYYLFTMPMGSPKRARRGGGYIAAIVLLSLFFSLLAGFLTESPLVFTLLLFPVSEAVKCLLDYILVRAVPPTHVPRMELRTGVPAGGRTICVVSVLLSDADSGAALARKIEEYHLSNLDCGKNLVFGLLVDLPASKEETSDGDFSAIAGASQAIDELNDKYGGGFLMLLRPRRWNPADREYAGWERKRGAVLELAQLLSGEKSTMKCAAGDSGELSGIRYILTLDSDTRLCPGAARELIGSMLHPLNTPVIDEQKRVVVRGHGIIHPRMAVELDATTKSDLARLYAGQGGTDPYGSSGSELYMDMFESGGFAGKGIIDIHALLTCTDNRFPDNRVLSHDALEGALLRGGYAGDVELTDGFPSTAAGYFSRMHRWVRGDWQNLPWLFSKGHALSDIDRWKLFDSIRRSLVPVFVLAAVLCGVLIPGGSLGGAAAAAVLMLISGLLPAMTEAVLLTRRSRSARFRSRIIRGAGGALLKALVRLILLPYEAWICLSAAATALWRMAVSHRKLLAWRTALQGDRSRTAAGCYIDMWFAVVTAAACILLSPFIIAKAAGVVWLFSPLFAFSISRERRYNRELAGDDRQFLHDCAQDIWRYFLDFCRPEDNWLPPDNWQEQPPVGLAHRTSPTNIGLCLLSALAAVDLKICDATRAFSLISNMLDTIERMPKYAGHLFNWYDTRTLKSLTPRYVSTVDSGNLACCLTVLRNGLEEYKMISLADRVGALLREMDFSLLYDESRRMFFIGIDVDRGKPSTGWYDMLCSEARATAYYAIASGQVDRRCWRRLSRALVQKDGFRGMASWTGSMFEYLMPELFIPCYRDSLLYETARFCLHAQKKRPPVGVPWGISESAFFSLDPSLSYRYKAHGCAALALKRGMDSELVISPYSSFLSLSVEPRAAIKNLRRLDSLDTRGKYGFWEALDFTAGRRGGERFRTVRCVMSHHLGMSMLAIANCLCNDAMPRRFMSDPAMSAHRGLLQEKVPLGGTLLRRNVFEEPEKPNRGTSVLWRRSGEGVDTANPSCCLLSNSIYNIMLTESGMTRTLCNGMSVYRAPVKRLDPTVFGGMFMRAGDELTPLLPDASCGDFAGYSWSFSPSSGEFRKKIGDIKAKTCLSVAASEPGELRRVHLESQSPGESGGELIFAFEPVLAPESDYVNHPAFWRLGLHASIRDGALIIRRLRRSRVDECYLCLLPDQPAMFSCNRERVSFSSSPIAPEGQWLSNPLVCARIPISFDSAGEFSARFAIAVGRTADEAYKSACLVLTSGDNELASLPAACASLLGMDASDVGFALDVASRCAFQCASDKAAAANIKKCAHGKNGLWALGISGDLPIICAELSGDAFMPLAERLIKSHALLSACGLTCDLVFMTDDGGDYRRAKSSSVTDILRRLDFDHFIGTRGGVHLVDSGRDTACLLASSRVLMSPEGKHEKDERQVTKTNIMLTNINDSCLYTPQYQWNPDNSFEFYVNHSLPPRAWSSILTNGNFGWFASDAGTGHMWYKNARECPIARWVNDISAVRGTETLELVGKGGRTSLFAAPDDHECTVRFGFGYAEWRKQLPGGAVTTTAFVPHDIDARVFIITREGSAAEGSIAWFSELLLSSDPCDSAHVVTERRDGALSARSVRCPYPGMVFSVCTSDEPEAFTCDRISWMSGEPDGSCGAGLDPCFGLLLPPAEVTVIVCGTESTVRLKSLTDPAVAAQADKATREYWQRRVSVVTVSTPDAGLDRIYNGWVVYQALACRIMGRTSIYQSGGAFGFRDQLQDCVNLILTDPSLARNQIILSCARQYEEGDVQHWWHQSEEGTRGVRTRCSDDLLWLPWAVCEYVEKTGDVSVCEARSHYLSSEPLSEDESDRYEYAPVSTASDTVIEHCRRAIGMVISRGTGLHGLLHLGSGDWNDGLDAAGEKGRGESVWLTWFFSIVTDEFSKLLGRLGDESGAERYALLSEDAGRAATSAWDGEWFRRGYFDSGEPFGSTESDCCTIDSVAQSFSVFSPHCPPKLKKTAINSAVEHLFDREHNLVRLFVPPFEDFLPNPGYIMSYGPGFRENGGQYTHGSLWLALACLISGRTDDGYAMLRAMLPTGKDVTVYGAEPFVVAADVYAAPGSIGLAGWSWYTGSAGWLYRIITEALLGLKLHDGLLFVEPNLPTGWSGYTATVRSDDGTQHQIEVRGGEVFIDSAPASGPLRLFSAPSSEN